MTAILGLSAYYHDSAAALIIDGEIRAACQQERFSRRKHDERFPTDAISSVLAQAGLGPDDIDYVAYYEKPLLKFERLLETYVHYAPRGFRAFSHAMPGWLRDKLRVRQRVRRALDGTHRRRIIFCEHHESHAASAFFPSPFIEAAILTMDGVGEWATASLAVGRGNRIELLKELRFPHSLGLLYSAFTTYCGFRVNDGEYKLMGLAPYGEPVYAESIIESLIDLKDDGSFRMDMDYFRYGFGMTMTSDRFHRLFGGPPRREDGAMEQRFLDAAASIQQVTEEVVMRCARYVHRLTGVRQLCLAGGVALNCVANGRLLREGPFDSIWIQPAAGDAGGALGAGLLTYFQLLQRERTVGVTDRQQGSRLGPASSVAEIEQLLSESQCDYRKYEQEDELLDDVATDLSHGKIVGWFQGRMEFGPRALGGRSILADPRDPTMQRKLNQRVKRRESFRPFAPAVLIERAADYFDIAAGVASPYMLLVAPLRSEHRRLPSPDEVGETNRSLAQRLEACRSSVPAVTHVDHSSRIQTVAPDLDARFYGLIRRFEQLTGCPMLINTSFNLKDEPIVCGPEDALRCFREMDLDVLVLENLVVRKEDIVAQGDLPRDA